ncbi:MAG TPA: hypothetical protein DIT54_06475 [Lachnospiraceae bacterium]|nr:hypothetical protein [Lachnospiraceae bacterium]
MEEKTTLLLYDILDPISFFQEIDECKGAIYVKSYKGLQDLRKNYFMQYQLLWQLPIGIIEKIQLTLEKEEDVERLLSFIVDNSY